MTFGDLISMSVPSALNRRVCSRSDCQHHGLPQPMTNFYKKKSACKDCCMRLSNRTNERRRERMQDSPYVVDREPGGYLEIAPWRDWITRQIEVSGGRYGGGMQVVAWELGVTERSVSRWLTESKHVMLDVADRALCRRGTPWVLRELYPSLYEFEDVA